MKKRILPLILCAALLTAIIPTVLTASAIEVEGDWTTYRFASQYEDPDAPYDPNQDPVYYMPEAGYHYTDEGFTTLRPEYDMLEPRMTVASKEVQEVKKGIYLQFRVDEFCYDADRGADEWIALTLSTEHKVEPGSSEYGGGWMVLIRGKGDGACTAEVHLTNPDTANSKGSVTALGTYELTVPLDEKGREIYTLEITRSGSAYEMKLNGVVLPDGEAATKLLEELNPYGEYYVGINMYAAVNYGMAGLTILKYGENEATAVPPAGSDSKSPGEYCIYPWPEIRTEDVPAGQPARVWDASAHKMKEGYNLMFSVSEDSLWHGKALAPYAFLYFSLWSSNIYTGTDFPVVALLFRNLRADTVSVIYNDGWVSDTEGERTVTASVSDGEVFGEAGEYVLIPVELTVPQSRSIESLRIGLTFSNMDACEFDLCYVGAFRSAEEARQYTMDKLQLTSETTAPETEPPTEFETPIVCGPVETETLYDRPVDPVPPAEGETAKDTAEGCTLTVGFGGVALMAAIAAAVALKKKD